MTSLFEDDPGAPGPDAYTAAEKRSRAKSQRVMLLAGPVLIFLVVLWWLL